MHYAFHIRIYGLILDKYGRRKNMGKYLLKRILQAIGVIFCISLITFFVLNIVPGNPVEIMPVSYTHLDVYKRQGLML